MIGAKNLKLNASHAHTSAPPWPTTLALTALVGALHLWLLLDAPQDCRAVIGLIAQDFTRSAAGGQIALSLPDAPVLSQLDPDAIARALRNLIENALKENLQPGLVITLSGQWSEAECVLKVSDNGTGIPAHDLPFVFKRFFRGDKHHSSAVKGTGLGLSIVKRAVEAHRGTITATSQPGLATTFTMTVPV
jgi:signal transduction histidine kinase